jgi:hypothetical protein
MIRRVVKRMNSSDLAQMPQNLPLEGKILQREFASQYIRNVFYLDPGANVEVQSACFPS